MAKQVDIIKHHPYLDTDKVEELYSNKDGVPIKYVCTSGRDQSATAGDIFFRDTPHPEFSNRYFVLFSDNGLRIAAADWVENELFDMIEGPDGWEYSQHRHDFRRVGKNAIDGGRAYLRLSFMDGVTKPKVRRFNVKDGEFIEVVEEKAND